VNDEWPALLAAIAQQKVLQQKPPEVLGFCGVGNREIEVAPADPDLANLRVVASAKLVVQNRRS
jgi:hypothetical protein